MYSLTNIDTRFVEIIASLGCPSPQDRMSLQTCNKKLKSLLKHYNSFSEFANSPVKDLEGILKKQRE